MHDRLKGVLRRPRTFVIVGAAALLALVVGVATAAIPDSNDGEIHGCYQKNNGQLRVIDAQAGATCRPSEIPLVWSQEGPSGPSGPSGPVRTVRAVGAQRPVGCERRLLALPRWRASGH